MIKSAVYGLDFVAINTVKMPVPSKNQVIVKVLKAGLNPVDAKKLIGDKVTLNPDYLVKGYGIGFDFAGEIVYENLTAFRKGEKVFGTMPPFKAALQEFIAVPIDQIARIPDHLSVEEAACLPLCGLTCVQAFERFNLKQDSKVLIVGGSGGVGHLAIQIAKSLGCTVVSIQSAKNFGFVKTLGADFVVDYRDFQEMLNGLEELGPFDLIFDTVSDISNWNYPPILRNYCKSSTNHSYITLGGSTWLWFMAFIKRSLGWNFFESWHELFWVVFPNSSGYLEVLSRTGCKPVVQKQYPFSVQGIMEAFDALLERRTKGKLVVAVSDIC